MHKAARRATHVSSKLSIFFFSYHHSEMDYLTRSSSPSSPISNTFDFDSRDFSSPSLSSPSPGFRPFPSYSTSPNMSFMQTQDTSNTFLPFKSQPSHFDESLEDSQSRHGLFGPPPNPSPTPRRESTHSMHIPSNASHSMLLQSGNHVHTELYRAYLQVQAEIKGLKYVVTIYKSNPSDDIGFRYAYTTLATNSRSSTAMGLAAGHTSSSSLSSSASSPYLQLATSQPPPPQTPLNENNYPSVKYWHATSWTNSKTNKDIDIFTSLKAKKKSSFWYLEDANGTSLNEERCNAVTKRARQIFAHLNASGAGAAKWGDMGNVSQDYYRREMYSCFPELRLCELDWKVNRLATETYSSWYRKRKDKLVTNVKQEDTEKHHVGSVAGESSGVLLQYKQPQTPSPLQQVPCPKKVKSSDPSQPPARPPTSCPQPTPHWASVPALKCPNPPVAAPSTVTTPVLPAPSPLTPVLPTRSLPSPACLPTSYPRPTPRWTGISTPKSPNTIIVAPSTPVLPAPPSPSPACRPTSHLQPTFYWTGTSAPKSQPPTILVAPLTPALPASPSPACPPSSPSPTCSPTSHPPLTPCWTSIPILNRPVAVTSTPVRPALFRLFPPSLLTDLSHNHLSPSQRHPHRLVFQQSMTRWLKYL